MFIIALAFTVLAVYASWRHRYRKELKNSSVEDLKIIFKDKHILFPAGYYYKYSWIKSNTLLSIDRIAEINLNTSPPSMVINDNEVIFIPYKMKSDLEDFGKRNNVFITDRFDVWSAINEPFLDTEFDEAYLRKTKQSLIENGLTESEIQNIRKKIKFTMLSSNAFAWEWQYLGQFDYLKWTLLTKKKYWWSMEIALRNFQASS